MENKDWNKEIGLGVASLVLGILTFTIGWIPVVNYFSLIPAIIGIILGAVSLGKKMERGMSIAGVVLNVCAVLFVIIYTILFTVAVVSS